jgi:DeoR/GlpR family transcriptional regulator of sugar metabolism
MNMNAKERHSAILQLIADKGMVTVTELCERFGVSDMTIRRDLSTLEGANLLRRMYGGAIAARGRSFEPPLLIRAAESTQVKAAIGAYAASLVRDGDSIALDVGTTTLQMARNLSRVRALTVITASLPIVNVLVEYADIRVVVAGGILRREELSMIGSIAEETFQRFNVDKVFIGTAGLDAEGGLTEYNLDDARVKEYLIRSGQRRILLADSGKLGRRKLARVAALGEIHELVTDDGLDDDFRAVLHKIGILVHVVEVNKQDSPNVDP